MPGHVVPQRLVGALAHGIVLCAVCIQLALVTGVTWGGPPGTRTAAIISAIAAVLTVGFAILRLARGPATAGHLPATIFRWLSVQVVGLGVIAVVAGLVLLAA